MGNSTIKWLDIADETFFRFCQFSPILLSNKHRIKRPRLRVILRVTIDAMHDINHVGHMKCQNVVSRH